MIVALFGHSCTGKTTVGLQASARLKMPLRSCGEAVKLMAKTLSVPIGELSDEQHLKIDKETRQWVVANDPCIVEGRYLDHVLSSVDTRVLLIRLEATVSDRRARRGDVGAPALTITDDELDAADSAFCARMYSLNAPVAPQVVLNSSDLSVDACVQRIVTLLSGVRLG